MRSPLEVWILVWILWTQVLNTVGVYNVNYHIPLIESTGQGQPNTDLTDTSRTQDQDQVAAETLSETRVASSEHIANVQGPLRDLIMDRQEVHCVELKSKRYISDGFCTSIRPITEVVCAGTCEPNAEWYSEYIKTYGNNKRKEWRCVNDNVRQKKVRLLCDDEDTRTYRIKTVRSCKCKRLQNQHNQSHRPAEDVSSRQPSSRKSRNRNNRQ